jgi:transposase
MLNNYFIEKILGLQDAEVKNVENNDNITVITFRLKRKAHKCPCCGQMTDKIHDYREQVVKDAPVFGSDCQLIYEKRRYVCKCGKRFAEQNSFLPRYHRMSLRLILLVLEMLKSTVSFTYVAKEVGLSTSTVIRIFDTVGVQAPKLTEVVSIDEFKGNTGGEKYNCIITDPVNHKVLDILPSRHKSDLSSYFKRFPNRSDTAVFISDMWKPYYETASIYFKKAKFVVDKYHWIRQVLWAFDRVRKDIQKQFQKDYRTYFKHSRKLLFKRYDKLEETEKQQVSVMLSVSPTLYSAHFLKEQFLKILDCENRDSAKKLLTNWIDDANDSGIISFVKCAKTMYSWFTGILNSFDTPFTNGFTEGCNNKIKVLKRNAYGYHNFKRFRKRILYIFS